MAFLTDIEIAQSCTMQPITEIAKVAGVDEEYLEMYGKYKAKVDYKLLKEVQRPDGKLILVTAINPTPAGEGKTTTTVGLADGLKKLGKNVMVALREPSLGPVFGVKGGAAGGGYAQVVPMEDINLHFTGDFHAIGAANNLLAAMLDNHIQQGGHSALGLQIAGGNSLAVVGISHHHAAQALLQIGDGGGQAQNGHDLGGNGDVEAVLAGHTLHTAA